MASNTTPLALFQLGQPPATSTECPACGGTGESWVWCQDGSERPFECRECEGQGWIYPDDEESD